MPTPTELWEMQGLSSAFVVVGLSLAVVEAEEEGKLETCRETERDEESVVVYKSTSCAYDAGVYGRTTFDHGYYHVVLVAIEDLAAYCEQHRNYDERAMIIEVQCCLVPTVSS